MKRILILILGLGSLLAAPLATAVGIEKQVFDPKKAATEPKFYVGSDVCKSCHLEHHDAWKRTLHSRMLQDAKANQDVFVTELDPEVIRADLKKIESKLKVPLEEIYIPKKEEVLFTIGSQWKQRYLIERNGDLYIAPVQYLIDSGTWVTYHEHD